MKLSISEILEKAGKFKEAQDRINYLRENDSRALQDIIQYAWHPDIKWDLPEGAPPYKPSDLLDQEAMLYREIKKLAIFVNGNGKNISPVRLETLFLQLLESVDPKDAKLLIKLKEGKLPRGITNAVVAETWPGLIPDKKHEEVQ